MASRARSKYSIDPPDAKASVPIAERIDALSWERIADELELYGCAVVGPVLSPAECTRLAALYGKDEQFRSRIVMRRHGFGSGEYKYFGYPVPDSVGSLRAALYPRLAPIANRWSERMGSRTRYPAEHEAFR